MLLLGFLNIKINEIIKKINKTFNKNLLINKYLYIFINYFNY